LERNLTPEEARKELIDLVRQGRTIADALKVIVEVVLGMTPRGAKLMASLPI